MVEQAHSHMSLSTVELSLLTGIFIAVAAVLVYLLKAVQTISTNQTVLAKDLKKVVQWFDSYRDSPLGTGQGLKDYLATESLCKEEIFHRISAMEHDLERACEKLEIPMQRSGDLPKRRNPCAPAKVTY